MENYLEDILRKYFQKDVKFIINEDEFKKGKFLLYKIMTYGNNYYVEFTIKTDKKIDLIKVPYPFNVENYPDDNLLYFDFRIKTLCKNNVYYETLLKEFSKKEEGEKYNKFFDNILEIKFE